MAFNHRGVVFVACASLLTTAAAQAFPACPSGAAQGTTGNGYPYQICPNSDYQGPSTAVIQNIASTKDCVQLCADDAQCVNAVYDKANKVCHKKAVGGLTFAADNRFDSAQVNVQAVRSVINKCPYAESVYTTKSGVKYQICAATDYEGASRQAIEKVASNNACNQICETTNGCTKTVYDTVGQVCHIKQDDGNRVWVTNRRFITSRIVNVASPAAAGRWSDIITVPVIPAAGYMVPSLPDTSKILFFSSFAAYTQGGNRGYTMFADYNLKTGATSQRKIANTQHDMFCPGISQLGDGRIVVTGGDNAEVTSIYDPVADTFVRGPNMTFGRGYQSSATLSNGRVFTIGGSYSGGIFNKPGESYDATTNTWTKYDGCDAVPMWTTYDAEGDWRRDNHAWLFGWTGGTVFQAGPSKEMHWFNPSGNGSVTSAGFRDRDNDAMCGTNVMYDTGKIFAVSGTQSYIKSPPLARAYRITIGQVGAQAKVERLADINFPRGFANLVVLPDGKMLITGGQSWPVVFTDNDAILVPELYDPATNTWKRLAAAAVPRQYHSISLLLPDATVLAGGGGLCWNPNEDPKSNCDRTADHPNFEIFSPPYLFNADGSPATRPVINSISTSTTTTGYKVRVGGTLRVVMSNANTGMTFALVRLGSVTHSTNTDQRRISLTNVRQNGNSFIISLPNDAGITIPGYWYLFAMNSRGVPSVAKTLQILV